MEEPDDATSKHRVRKQFWMQHGKVMPTSQTTTKGHIAVVDTVKYTQMLRQRKWYIIDPRYNKQMQYWDVATVCALIFTAIFTPVEASFLVSPKAVDGLFVINRLVDVVFLVDFLLSFILMYPSESLEGSRWIFDHRQIIKHYATTWMLLDFTAIAVSSVDIIALVEAAQLDTTDGTAVGSGIAKLKVLRVLRVLRLIKLLRLMRLGRLAKRWEAKMAINYGVVALLKALGMLMFGAHMFACLWTLQADLFSDNRHETWLGNSGLCWAKENAAPAALLTTDSTAFHGSSVCKNAGELYCTSFYWAVMTITGVGYGDITPVLWSEQLTATVVMLAGAMMLSQVIATICGVVATFNPEAAAFRNTMDDLNRFMASQGMEPSMRTKLREYFHQTKHLRMALASRHLMSQMSPALQAEVSWICNEKWLRNVWFLADAERGFVIQLSLQLSPMVFAPGELAAPGLLYIVHRGLALYGGRVIGFGKVWGEDVILANPGLQRKWCARAMNYLEVFVITREKLLRCTNSFPDTARRIRKAVVLLALKRYLGASIQRLKSQEVIGDPKARRMRSASTMSTFLVAASTQNGELGSDSFKESSVQMTAVAQSSLILQAQSPSSMPEDSPVGPVESAAAVEEMRKELSTLRILLDAKTQTIHGEMAEVKQRLDKLCAALVPE